MKILPGTPRPVLCVRHGMRAVALTTVFTMLLSASAAFAARIANLSTRAKIGVSDNNAMIAGITLQGSGAATLVFRGIGPSLAPYFGGGVLADPYLELRNANGTLLYSNNDWQESQASEISATGLAPTNPSESAIKYSLGAGAYTAILRGVGGGTGIAVVEAYDLTPQPSSISLVNIATRARTESSSPETVGMIIQGSGYKGVVIRGLGQSVPVAGYLPNPSLRLFNSGGAQLQYNENWKDTQSLHIWASGFAPVYDSESAMTNVANFAAGAYTATVSDNSGASGTTVLDIYDLGGAEIYEDAVLGGGLAYCCTPAIVRISPLIYPQSAGPITVHFAGYGSANCGGQPCNSYSARIYPELLDANGTVISTGESLFLFPANVSQHKTVTFNWTSAPYRIRMRSSSNASPSNPDGAYLQYWDIYGQ